MKPKLGYIGVIVLYVACMGYAGCHKVTVTNTPPGIVSAEVGNWFQAAGAVDTWADTSLKLTNAAIGLHSSFPNETVYQGSLAALGKENQIGLEATHFLQSVPQHFDATAQGQLAGFLDQGLAALDDATQVGLLQIKDPTTKALVDATVTSLRASLKTIFALTKPAGTPLPAALKG